jgi:hypothetical protein
VYADAGSERALRSVGENRGDGQAVSVLDHLGSVPPRARRTLDDVKIRCRFCRLPNPLRATVEACLGHRTMPYRQACRLTGIALSSLARHMANHWQPPVEAPSQPPPDKVVAPTVSRPGPHSSPCVIEMMDQAPAGTRPRQEIPTGPQPRTRPGAGPEGMVVS